MDNLSQQDSEKELENEAVDASISSEVLTQEGADIEFEEPKQEGSDVQFDDSLEAVDVYKIQEKLKEHMVEVTAESEGEDGGVFISEGDENLSADIFVAPKTLPEIDLAAKKYVIYINPENIEYMETLSPDERKVIINDALTDKQKSEFRKSKIEQRNFFTMNAIVVVLTVVICFPILFFMVNKSLELTIVNYGQAKENFVKLYKQQGKIKQENDFAPDNYNY